MADSSVNISAFGRPDKVHVLHPGDVAVGERGDHLETLLGSCVAVILTDPRRTVAAMCHIVHSGPTPSGGETTAHAEPAMEAMFGLLVGYGIDPLKCEAYVFGGGNMFPSLFKRSHVGESNAQWALDILADLGIQLITHDVGGTTYRRISWTVGQGAPQVVAVEV